MAYNRGDKRSERKLKRARNITITVIVIAFLFGIAIFAIFRWAVSNTEAPIYTAPSPSASRSSEPAETTAPPGYGQEPAASGLAASPSATIKPTVKGENAYDSENLSFAITKAEEQDPALVYYVVDIQIKDMSLLKGAFSGEGNAISRNVYETTSELSDRYNALLAINCDNSGFRPEGIIVRNGNLYRFSPSDRDMLMIFNDGSMKIIPEKSVSSEQQIIDIITNDGLLHVFSFGPALITDGKPTGDYSAFSEIGGHNPRTAIGMIEPGHFVLLILDGRIEKSEGVRLPELEKIMTGLGCTQAYNFDGGQSTTLIYDGKLINAIAGRETERGVTDILYFTEK